MVPLAALCVFLLWRALFLPTPSAAFEPLFSEGSFTHRKITELAILRKTAEMCRDQATAQGRDFMLTIDNSLTVLTVQEACSKLYSAHNFEMAIREIFLFNAAVDLNPLTMVCEECHFDNETFKEGKKRITDGMTLVKTNIDDESFHFARISLGMILHTLQDFYSHSNWVELENTAPFSNLIRPNETLRNIADKNTPTCRDCIGNNCNDNILPQIQEQKLLTSGYFALIFSEKPDGKCSHGGSFDRTKSTKPIGGINKDKITSEHGIYHKRAADLAISATMELLENIRLASGNQAFLRLMGLTQSSVLAFVIDTTGSMSDDIEDAKKVSFNIIDSRRGTPEEPSEYILVPFSDPDFGPLIRTGNADIFKEKISLLAASGGGDEPEMCLSGVQLALAGAPPSSDIFVFTDAAAKDSELESTIKTMVENTKSRINFLLTKYSFRKRRAASQSQRFSSRAMIQTEIQLYRDLARVSGGQAIEVTKATLFQATAVIIDSSVSALVTVLQVVRSPAVAENFSFVLDPSLSNVTVYVTGGSPVFTLSSPTGVSQASSVANGPLGSILTVGNLKRVKLNSANQTGEWRINIYSTSSYSLKVTGRSSVDFLFNFVEAFEGGHGNLVPIDNRPLSGRNATLFVSVTGGDSVTVTDVFLVEASGSNVVNGSIKAVGATDFLVNIDRIPEWAFVVQLKGLLSDSSTVTPFQRQSPTQQQGSRVTIMAQSQNTIEPGVLFSVNFTVVSNTTAGNYTIRARTDRDFSMSFPNSLVTGTEGSAQGTVTLTAPTDTVSGTDATLTIEAEDLKSGDSNYVVLRFTVLTKVTDFFGPVCQIVRIKADCPVECSTASWELSANLTDSNGTGIARVSLNRGNGSLSLSTVMSENGTNVTVASYNASCCSQEVELVAVDRVGNVGTCFTSIKSPSTTVSPNGSTSVTVTPNKSTTVSANRSTIVTVTPNRSTSDSPNGSTIVTVTPNKSTTVSANRSTIVTVTPNRSTSDSLNGSTIVTVTPNRSTSDSLNGSIPVTPSGSHSVSFSICVTLSGLLVSLLYGQEGLKKEVELVAVDRVGNVFEVFHLYKEPICNYHHR